MTSTSDLVELSAQAHSHAAARSQARNKDEMWRNVKLSALEKVFAQAQNSGSVSLPQNLPYETCISITNGVIQDPLCTNLNTAAAWHHDLVDSQDLSAQWILTTASAQQHYHLQITTDQQLCIYNHASNDQSACSISISVAANVRCDIILIHNVAHDARSNIAIHVDAAADSVTRIDECESSLDQGQILRHAFLSLQKNTHLTWNQCQVSSELNRSTAYVDLNGAHAHIDLTTATISNGDHQAHQYIRVHHAQPDTSSTQTFKCIATDHARFSFDGLIRIASGADGSNAEQINANLQLSDHCRVHSRPQLDIDTDDVIATHGSATGQIDEAEIHYLRTRGISDRNARRLITRGFLQEAIHRFHSDYAQKISTDLLNEVLG